MCARGKVNHHSFISRPAFAQAHGLGPGCWPLLPRTAPFKIRVTYEIPTDCSLRAYLTGDAPARVSYGSTTPTTENGDTYYTLPNGSGTCELVISSPGVDSYGVIMLVLVDADGNSHYLFSQSFNTVAAVIERERYITATNNPGRVCIRLSPSLYNAVADWTLSPSVDGGARLFASETGGSPLSSVSDVSEVWVSPGNHCRNYTVTATLDRYGLSDSSTFKTCGIVFEPVTTDKHNGRYVNPSHVVVGSNACFSISFSEDLLLSEVVWHASSSSVFMQQETGLLAVVTPAAEGIYSLTVDIADFEGPKPKIDFKAVEQTTTSVRAFILGYDNDFRTTPQQVTNLIAGVNCIYEQAGMRFVLEAVVSTNVPASWLTLDIGQASGADNQTGKLRHAWLPNDWGCSSTEVHFYYPFVDQPWIIQKMLMCGRADNYKGDIPLGNVYGVWYIEPPDGDSVMLSLAPISFSQYTTRNPVHK